jgi:hypothetical protein
MEMLWRARVSAQHLIALVIKSLSDRCSRRTGTCGTGYRLLPVPQKTLLAQRLGRVGRVGQVIYRRGL